MYVCMYAMYAVCMSNQVDPLWNSLLIAGYQPVSDAKSQPVPGEQKGEVKESKSKGTPYVSSNLISHSSSAHTEVHGHLSDMHDSME
jgi:hypothetical protein